VTREIHNFRCRYIDVMPATVCDQDRILESQRRGDSPSTVLDCDDGRLTRCATNMAE